jgi:hypothetical protein
MKNNLDQHIDSQLKTSFDAIQKKAPEYLWEQISEKMNVEDAIDASMDEKVQTVHLEAPLHKAPASIWDKIDDALEETTPIDTILDKKVKDGFSADSKAAPVFLWGAISNELSTPPISVDATLDDKLKEGFLAEEIKKTPNKVWYAVSRQLNIDKTWGRISKVLDKEPVVSDWSGRIVRFVAAAALLLLLLRTCTHEPYTIPNPNLVQQINNPTQKVTKSPIATLENGTNPSLQKQEKETAIATLSNGVNSGLQKQANSKQNKTPSQLLEATNTTNSKHQKTTNKNLIENVPTFLSKPSSERRKKETTKGRSSIIPPVVEDNYTKNPKEEPAIIAAVVLTESKKGSIASMVDTEVRDEITNGSTETTSPDENSTQSENGKELNPVLLDALALNVLTVENTVEPIQLLEEMQLEKKTIQETSKNLIEDKLEAGAFVVVNSTMLLNNETREGFDQNSLTTNHFGLAANYGLWVSYRILPRGALVAEFSINADNRQAYGTYEKGVFYIKEWVMKYNRVSLAYKHDLWQTNSDKLVNTKVVAQAGVYMGMLREAKLFYDGVLFFDKQSDYHQFDFGFKVALGQEILIDKFVLGYGIRSDIGAANIFKGNNQLNSKEDQTNVIHIGGYVLFGYRF